MNFISISRCKFTALLCRYIGCVDFSALTFTHLMPGTGSCYVSNCKSDIFTKGVDHIPFHSLVTDHMCISSLTAATLKLEWH